MKKYLFCFLIPVLLTACNTHKNKKVTPVRLTAITIHGDSIPQYSFQYDTAGHLVRLTKHYRKDACQVYSFQYDSSNRLAGMQSAYQDNGHTTIDQKATVSAWDPLGNVTEVQYYDTNNIPFRTARLAWKKGMPVALKCIDSTQAISWNYTNGNPDWKNISTDTTTSDSQDTSICIRNARYEWDDTINPLRPLVNQLVMVPGLSPGLALPLPELSDFLLTVSSNNPTLIKMDEQQKAVYGKTSQQYFRNNTIQFFYACKNGYPVTARVHFHSEGYTKLGSDTQVNLDYSYQ
ncbi:hypothetical protein [Chitinophaga sp. HK235]|uniref:hypothetical protein n=1 Tax=Chitinophaga sp. HK235 TaxID=2952571 RepID=UPI001BAC11C7|nr:hypothetical protein [Chitinophaga sp. HK235]